MFELSTFTKERAGGGINLLSDSSAYFSKLDKSAQLGIPRGPWPGFPENLELIRPTIIGVCGCLSHAPTERDLRYDSSHCRALPVTAYRPGNPSIPATISKRAHGWM